MPPTSSIDAHRQILIRLPDGTPAIAHRLDLADVVAWRERRRLVPVASVSAESVGLPDSCWPVVVLREVGVGE